MVSRAHASPSPELPPRARAFAQIQGPQIECVGVAVLQMRLPKPPPQFRLAQMRIAPRTQIAAQRHGPPLLRELAKFGVRQLRERKRVQAPKASAIAPVDCARCHDYYHAEVALLVICMGEAEPAAIFVALRGSSGAQVERRL